MDLYIYPNIISEKYINRVKNSITVLEEKGYRCFLSEDDSNVIYGDSRYNKKTIDECDLLVSLGGDGTLLRAVELAIKHNKNICGINCGHLGYLCAYRYDELQDVDFSALTVKNYPLLQYCDGQQNNVYALNDMVIGKDYFGGTIKLRVKVNDEVLYDFMGDGLIVSSALGSTCYNCSAGGKLLEKNSKQMVITPICPYTKGVESVVVDQNAVIEIESLKHIYRSSIYNDGIYHARFTKGRVSYGDTTINILEKD